MNDSLKIPDDKIFTIHISNNMELRNKLRTGLVKAQGKETEKIPIFVSWPEWLEDGIVCLYASDFHTVLRSAIHETTEALSTVIEKSGEIEEPDKEIQNNQDKNSRDSAHNDIAPDQMKTDEEENPGEPQNDRDVPEN